MSIFRDNSTLYVGLVGEHLKKKRGDEGGESLPNSNSTFEAMLDAQETLSTLIELYGDDIEITHFCIVFDITDGYGNPNDAIVIKIQCATETDAVSLQYDIKDWNEGNLVDCFVYCEPKELVRTTDWIQLSYNKLVSSLLANTTCK